MGQVIHSLTHVVAASLAIAALPARYYILSNSMVPNLHIVLLWSTWEERGGELELSYSNKWLSKYRSALSK